MKARQFGFVSGIAHGIVDLNRVCCVDILGRTVCYDEVMVRGMGFLLEPLRRIDNLLALGNQITDSHAS